MTLTKRELILALLSALLLGALGRELFSSTVKADGGGFGAREARELVRAVERNAEATRALVDAVRSLKR